MNENFEIKKIFNEQYTLVIDSDIKAVNVHMTSSSQMRWDFSILNISEEYCDVKLILLDHILLNSNNPLIKEVASLTNAFSRLYNELHIKINHEGTIIEVLNMHVIMSKWNQTKREMESIAANNPEIKNAIILNDNVFTNKNKVIENIQSSEFFLIFFNKVYGKKVPGRFSKNSLNIFNSANVNWSYHLSFAHNPLLSLDEIIIESFAEPSLLLNIGFYNRAYIQFANQIDTKKLDTSLIEKGIYRIEKSSGRIIEASLNREEIAHPEELYAKLKYTFYSDEILKYKMSDEYHTAKN